jgi:hypothetical protein
LGRVVLLHLNTSASIRVFIVHVRQADVRIGLRSSVGLCDIHGVFVVGVGLIGLWRDNPAAAIRDPHQLDLTARRGARVLGGRPRRWGLH